MKPPGCGRVHRAQRANRATRRQILDPLGEPTTPPRLLAARGPPLREMAGIEPDESDQQAHPGPDYEFDQRIAWQGSRRTDSLVAGDWCLRLPERQTSAARVEGTSDTDNGHAGAGFQLPSAAIQD